MKLCKWHTLVFRCPSCSANADYAAEIVEGPARGSLWDPAYWCERCSTTMRARDRWIYGVAFGPLMAMVGIFSMQALPPAWNLGHWAVCAFATACCAIVGWPLSRVLSRYLIVWEPRGPAAPTRAIAQTFRKDDE